MWRLLFLLVPAAPAAVGVYLAVRKAKQIEDQTIWPFRHVAASEESSSHEADRRAHGSVRVGTVTFSTGAVELVAGPRGIHIRSKLPELDLHASLADIGRVEVERGWSNARITFVTLDGDVSSVAFFPADADQVTALLRDLGLEVA